MQYTDEPNVLFHFLHHAHHRRVNEEWNARGLGDVGAPMLLAALYNAPATMDSYYRAEVSHDLYGT